MLKKNCQINKWIVKLSKYAVEGHVASTTPPMLVLVL